MIVTSDDDGSSVAGLLMFRDDEDEGLSECEPSLPSRSSPRFRRELSQLTASSRNKDGEDVGQIPVSSGSSSSGGETDDDGGGGDELQSLEKVFSMESPNDTDGMNDIHNFDNEAIAQVDHVPVSSRKSSNGDRGHTDRDQSDDDSMLTDVERSSVLSEPVVTPQYEHEVVEGGDALLGSDTDTDSTISHSDSDNVIQDETFPRASTGDSACVLTGGRDPPSQSDDEGTAFLVGDGDSSDDLGTASTTESNDDSILRSDHEGGDDSQDIEEAQREQPTIHEDDNDNESGHDGYDESSDPSTSSITSPWSRQAIQKRRRERCVVTILLLLLFVVAFGLGTGVGFAIARSQQSPSEHDASEAIPTVAPTSPISSQGPGPGTNAPTASFVGLPVATPNPSFVATSVRSPLPSTAPSAPPSLPASTMLRNALVAALFQAMPNETKPLLLLPGSCQNWALEWLVETLPATPGAMLSPGNVSLALPSALSFNRPLLNNDRVRQRFALAVLYCESKGPSSWIRIDGWMSTEHECSWYSSPLSSSNSSSTWSGQSSSCENGVYRHLRLQGNGLSGMLSPDLSILQALSSVHLGDNNIAGSIPAWSLPALNLLDLHANLLTGALFSGPVVSLRNLTHLNLACNRFVGSLDNQIAKKVPKLRALILSNNALDGTIPSGVGMLALRILGLDSNKLVGPVPSNLMTPALTSLRLNDNWLSGVFPLDHFLNVTRATNSTVRLRTLRLHRTNLTGDLTALCNLPQPPSMTADIVEMKCWCCPNGSENDSRRCG